MSRSMRGRTLVIGVDEAGYGPNIGPFVVACSMWAIPDNMPAEELSGQLDPEFQARPHADECDWIPLGDSKIVYQGNHGLKSLFSGVQGLLAMAGHSFGEPHEIVASSIDGCLVEQFCRIPWYTRAGKLMAEVHELTNAITAQNTLPTRRAKPVKSISAARRKLSKLKVEFLGFKTQVVSEEDFNNQVEKLGNKSYVLSHNSLQLIRSCITHCLANIDFQPKRIAVYCDKHGGRNFYQALLTHFFPECWFMADVESQACSQYRATFQELPMNWTFYAKGDKYVPSASASMMAKLTREVLMAGLNDYWREHIPELKTTAGYPGDSSRFASDIEGTAQRLGFRRDQWWRSR